MSYRYLNAVPKNELLRRLKTTNSAEELLTQLQAIRGDTVQADDLRSASHDELIDIAKTVTGFTEEDAHELHEQYRYRGTKTLYIHTYPEKDKDKIDQILQTVEMDDLNVMVQRISNERSATTARIKKFSDITMRGIDQFDVEENSLWELVYSYVVQIKTTNPATEEVTFYPDLRYGFIWVNRTSPWIVIATKDGLMSNLLVQAMVRLFNSEIVRLLTPEDAEVAVEGYENVRKATHVDSNGIKRKLLHRRLSDFEEEVETLQQRDANQLRASSGYNATMDQVEFVLNYIRERGAISLSKLLSTTQLREFGTEKVSRIYQAVLELQDDSPGTLVELVVDRELAGARRATKEGIQHVLEKLVSARQDDQNESTLEIGPFELSKLHKYFTVSTEVYCDGCGEPQYIRCSECENDSFRVQNGDLVCKKCGSLVTPSSVQCFEGHDLQIMSLEEVMFLSPTKTLLNITERVIAQASSIKCNKFEEGYVIRGRTLHIFGNRGTKTMFLMGDTPEYQEANNMHLSEQDRGVLKQLLGEYREKCTRMSTENCSRCTDERQDDKHCLMRLFGLYHPEYTPRPHGNGEFGDVALNVTINGRQQTMLVLLKKGNPNGWCITKRRSIGQDIFSQIDDFWTDERASIIGIGVAQRFDDGFVAKLRGEAQKRGKKLVFFGVEELSKIVQTVVNKHNINLDDL